MFYPFNTGNDNINTNQTQNATSNKIYCKCNGQSNSVCSNNLARNQVSTNDRRKRSTSTTNQQVSLSKSIDLSQFEEPLKNASKDTCNETLANNVQLILCDQKGIININELVTNCKLDFNSTGIDIWPAKYLESQKSKCKFVLVNDQSLQPSTTVNGQIVYSIPTDFISNLCLNNCSMNGQCSSSGVCVCNIGYDGADCSINLKQPPNITYFSLQNNICNTRLENCYEIYFVGSGFSNSDNGNSLVNLAIYNPIKKILNNNTNLSSSNLFVITNKVFFLKLDNQITNITRNINKRSIDNSTSSSYSNYTMSATLKFSNDQNNGTFSNQVSFLIYDSLCQQCDSNNACTIKVKLYLIYKLFFYF
jgi:hypothetical protein